MGHEAIKFTVGQLIHHRKFDYRGVIVGVDLCFQLSDEWYDQVARSRPPKDRPWYRVLVDETNEVTYVAERHLEPDASHEEIEHPLIGEYFSEFRNGYYVDTRSVH